MRSLILVCLVGVANAGCTSKKTDSRAESSGPAGTTDKAASKSDDTSGKKATQPSNVSGGMELHSLECSVNNRNESVSQNTVIGCTIKDESGQKFRGAITNILAEIYINGSLTPVPGVVTILESEQSYNFAVSVPNLSPKDALSIKVGAALNGVVEQWLTSLLQDNVKSTTADMDLYVNAAATTFGPLCTKAFPCKLINLALAIVPTQIGHKVTIHVAAGRYDEAITVVGKVVSRTGGSLNFIGQDRNFVDDKAAIVDLYPPQGLLTGIALSGLNNLTNDLQAIPTIRINNFRITRTAVETDANDFYAFGFYSKSSDATLESVSVRGAWDVGIGAAFSSQITLSNVVITDFAISGLNVYLSAQTYIGNGNLSITSSTSQAVVGIYVQDRGAIFSVLDEGTRPSIKIEFLGDPIEMEDQVGLLVENASFEELLNTDLGPPVKLSIINASSGIKVDGGRVKLNHSDLDVTGCSSHCVWTLNRGSMNMRGINDLQPLRAAFSASSAADGAIFLAERFGSVEISANVKVNICNSIATAEDGRRYIAAAALQGTIFTQISSALANGYYDGCNDSERNRFIRVDAVSKVLQDSGNNLRSTDEIFLSQIPVPPVGP